MNERFTKSEKISYISCCYIFMVNGVLALLIGALLPFIRQSSGITYSTAGFLVSAHAIGNLCSSFLGGVLPLYIGRRRSTVAFCLCGIVAFAMIISTSSPLLLIAAFFLTGINRGAVSNFNNAVVNDIATGKAWALNILHAVFCIGAFSAPFAVLLATRSQDSHWIYAVLLEIFLIVTQIVLLLFMHIPNNRPQKEKRSKADMGFMKNPHFITALGILFSYLCTEQAINGWLVTYLKDSGIMSAAFSQIMTAVLWITMMVGRIAVARLSAFIKSSVLLTVTSIGYFIFALLLILSRTPSMAAIGVIGIGLFMAGVYPTTIACAGRVVKDYPLALSVMLTIAGLGAIIMPGIIGAISEYTGIVGGMSVILVAVLATLILVIYNAQLNKRSLES